jgi:hypothetical protein
MFQQVVDYLEAKRSPPSEPAVLADEARAAVAVCVRWGSYFAVLTDASCPLAPNVHDRQVSQIDDDEMARLNIEISAAIEWWLSLKGSDEQRYVHLVQQAVAHLPLGERTIQASLEGDILRTSATREMAAAIQNAWPEEYLEKDLRRAETHGVRAVANTIVLLSWRNGPVENVHEGWTRGHALNERRMLPQDEHAILQQARNGIHAALQAMEHLAFDGAWPPPAGRVLPFMRPFCHPRDWSYTEQSRVVKLPLRADSLPKTP